MYANEKLDKHITWHLTSYHAAHLSDWAVFLPFQVSTSSLLFFPGLYLWKSSLLQHNWHEFSILNIQDFANEAFLSIELRDSCLAHSIQQSKISDCIKWNVRWRSIKNIKVIFYSCWSALGSGRNFINIRVGSEYFWVFVQRSAEVLQLTES